MIYIHVDIIKRDFFFIVTTAESTEYIDRAGELRESANTVSEN